MNNLIKFTFDIFAHVIPGIIILVAFSLLTISLKPQKVITKPSLSEQSLEIDSQKQKSKNTEMKLDFGLVTEVMNNLEGSTGKSIFIIIFAYIIGFAVSPFGKFLYRLIGKMLWPNIKVENEIEMHISDKFILIREHSPANFEYVERWNMYASLSHNLAIACLVFFGVSIVQLFIDDTSVLLNWGIIGFISIALFFIFIKSAVVYNQWAGRDLNSAISALKLREKS